MIGVKGLWHKLGEIDLLATPFGQISTKAMIRQVQHLGLYLRLRADISIAGGATSGTVRNRGLAAALLRRININENGDRSTEIDPSALNVFSQGAMAPKEKQQVNALLNADIQANTILEDSIYLPFACPLLGSPHETNFLERDPDQALELELETFVGAETLIPIMDNSGAGDRVGSINSFTVEIGQKIDRQSRGLPLFIPSFRQIANQPIVGPVADYDIPLKPNGFVAALVVQQLGGGNLYETDDVISAVQLRGSSVRHFDGRFTDDWMRQLVETEFGGTIPVGYTFYSFLQNGRLGGIHNPALDPDLKLMVDADVSALAGGSSIRVWALEFNQDPALTRPLPKELVG